MGRRPQTLETSKLEHMCIPGLYLVKRTNSDECIVRLICADHDLALMTSKIRTPWCIGDFKVMVENDRKMKEKTMKVRRHESECQNKYFHKVSASDVWFTMARPNCLV